MEPVRYVVVVHGIGQQRKNETVQAVVDRFAEARRAPAPDRLDVLTLGRAAGQTGKEVLPGACRYQPPRNAFGWWLEFDGIPAVPPDPLLDTPFLAEPATSGDNLRFVDLWWADVTQGDLPDVAEKPEDWAAAVIGRLERKAGAARAEGGVPPQWTTEVLRRIAEVVGGVRLWTSFRAKELDDLVFYRFLGDVQLYGEFAYTRGQAVRRFHDLMARVRAQHARVEGKRPARFTILAHSLGTVLSLDALLYAHARADLRLADPYRGASPVPNFPFPGYLKPSEVLACLPFAREGAPPPPTELGFVDTSWVDEVDSLVTLGSPIDKYLVMWWQNYRYLLDRSWLDPARMAVRGGPGGRIRHFNLSEEQDPVGHRLDVARSAPVVRSVFVSVRDLVYRRSAHPGLSHVSYWGDADLFRWILHHAVDQGRGRRPPEPQWFLLEAAKGIQSYTYFIIPTVVGLAAFVALTLALHASGWQGCAFATLAFGLLVYVGRRLIDLSLWWRRVNRCKGPGSLSRLKPSPAEVVARKEFDRWSTQFTWLLRILMVLLPMVTSLALVHVLRRGSMPVGTMPLIVFPVTLALVALFFRRLAPKRAPTLRPPPTWPAARQVALLAGSYALAVGLGIFFYRWHAGGGAPAVTLTALGEEGTSHLEFNIFLFGLMGTLAHSYLWWRFWSVKNFLARDKPGVDFPTYAADP